MAVKLSDQIARATDELLKNPDWAANLAIIDRLNRQPDKGQKAADYIKKRLQHKSADVATLALALVDGLVKNCPNFIQFVATSNFMKAVVKLTEDPKKGLFRRRLDNEENILRGELKEKALVLIQQWGKTFVRSNRFPIFFTTFQQLQNRGVRFPQPNVDEVAPVVTPPRQQREQKPVESKTPEAVQDKQCLAAAENAALLWDMLTASSPREDLRRNDLVQTLLNNCRAGQAHVMQRVTTNPPPNVLNDLLATNDKLLEAIEYYNGLLAGSRQRIPRVQPKPASPKPARRTPEPKTSPSVPAIQPPPGGPEQGPEPLDLFGGDPISPVEPKKARRKKKRDHGEGREEGSGREGEASPTKAVPALAPPGSDKKKKRGRKRSQGSRAKVPAPESAAAAEGTDVLDMLFGSPEPTPSLERHVTDEAADDEFMALALREVDEPAKGAADADGLDAFFDEIASR